jgi:glutathione S-transferase
MTLTLFHSPRSRSSSFIWLLEELGVSYELKIVDIRRGDGSGSLDPANPQPHGKVPAILHDGVLVHEQTAICLYLTDAFPKAGLGPVVGDKRRGPYVTWLSYYSGVIEPAFFSKFMKIEVPRGSAGWVDATEVMAHVAATLQKSPYLTGDSFTSVDLLVGGTFNLFWQSPNMIRTPAIEAYVKRCMDRPARLAAEKKDNG